jgi:hypothetical protein
VPFTYEVPEGWDKGMDRATVFNLGRESGPAGFMAIWPDFAVATREGCAKQAASGVGRSAADLVDSLVGHPGLIASKPVAMTVDRLNGRMIDVREDTTWKSPCPEGVSVFVATADDVGWMQVIHDTSVAIAAFDLAKGHTLMIWIEATRSAFADFKAAAMRVVKSIEFAA